MTRFLILAIAAALSPAAASAAIRIERPEIRATIGAQPTAAAYMVVRNTGRVPDQLISAECACAESVMAHRTVVQDGVSRMLMETSVAIPPHGQVAFTPKGLHLMLTGVKAPIAAGSRTPLVLTFARAGRVRVAFVGTDRPGETDGASAPHGHHAR